MDAFSTRVERERERERESERERERERARESAREREREMGLRAQSYHSNQYSIMNLQHFMRYAQRGPHQPAPTTFTKRQRQRERELGWTTAPLVSPATEYRLDYVGQAAHREKRGGGAGRGNHRFDVKLK